MTAADFTIGDPVAFATSNGQRQGHLATKGRRSGTVVVASGREYSVPWQALQKAAGQPDPTVQTRIDRAKSAFAAGDAVSFTYRGEQREGSIGAMHKRQAQVLCCDGHRIPVAYSNLRPIQERSDRSDRLNRVSAQARELLTRHDLADWSFQFDDATKRGGCCRYTDKLITLSRGYTHAATDEQITDTILHEIAHALAGAKHHHNETWKEIARSIGCNAETCHQIRFTPDRWQAYCPKCQFSRGAQVRRKLICRNCRVTIRYRANPQS